MAKLTFSLCVDGLPQETFVVTGYQGKESISEANFGHGQACYGFRYHFQLASREQGITAEKVVDKIATMRMERNGEVVQYLHGIVRQFSHGDVGHNHTVYSLILVPALERLAIRQNSRIFQMQSVDQIITQLMQEMGIVDFSFALTRTMSPREFCVQYRESDLAFIQRLVAEEGLTYFIEQTDEKHTVVFVDSSIAIAKHDVPITHNSLAGGVAELPYISQFAIEHQTASSHLQFKDYSFKKPAYGFLQQQKGADLSFQQDGYEHYDFPGRYKEDQSGKAFSQYRLEYLRRETHIARGKSNHPALRAGVKFDLTDNLEPSANRDWLVVEVSHQGTQPQALEEEGGYGATTYSNQFKLIPASKTWRAKPQPKPRVDGPMIALVVGPKGEEIYCDEHGRVKLHFPWDRYSNGDEHSSCWVRVSQGWAGAQYGIMAVPRIGHEVIVEFLHGDPDQPIVTGRTYHANNTPPYALPDNKTKTVFRSETHQGQGFNELSFEDQADNEKLYLHAQKDYHADVLNDHATHIKHDKHLLIENDRFTQIDNDKHQVVTGESRSQVKKDKTQVVDGSEHQKIGRVYAVQSGREVHIKSGAKIVLEAGSEQTFKVGENFIKLDAAGVHIVGSVINLNSGGSAGKGSGFGGQMPKLPYGVESPPPPEEGNFQLHSVPITSLIAAVKHNAFAVGLCQQHTGEGPCPYCDVPGDNDE